jgi:hypothetical protein
MTAVIPHLAGKYMTFESYARASLTDIFGSALLAKAHRFEVNTLESGVLLNDGSGHFHFQSLPRLAQTSPGFGVVLTDMDGDGKTDLYLVQNFFSPQPETGRMDGGVSILCRGNGDGTFTPIPPEKSGLMVTGDAKSLVTTDLNGDGWPDFLVGINDAEPLAYINRGSTENRVINLRLKGKAGNPTAIGSRVTITSADGSRQTAEVLAGGGYFSQSSGLLTFGLGRSSTIKSVYIRWPNGASSSHSVIHDQKTILISQPD